MSINEINRLVSASDKVSSFLEHAVLEGNGSLFIKGTDETVANVANLSMADFAASILVENQTDTIVDGFNYLIQQKEQGRVYIIKDIYSKEDVEEDPDKGSVQGLLYQGEPGMPIAIVIPGGGFESVNSFLEGIPEAMELHRKGYSVFVLSYRVNKELHFETQEQKGEEAARDVAPTVRYLLKHQEQYGYTMNSYAMFGFSAGGLMNTAFAFSNFKDCCHKHGLPRPAMISPIYGLLWDIEATEEDKDLAVFSRVGKNDYVGFGNVESKVPALREKLGKENVNIIVYDDFPHSSGLGVGTEGEGWIYDAIAFWEDHRR